MQLENVTFLLDEIQFEYNPEFNASICDSTGDASVDNCILVNNSFYPAKETGGDIYNFSILFGNNFFNVTKDTEKILYMRCVSDCTDGDNDVDVIVIRSDSSATTNRICRITTTPLTTCVSEYGDATFAGHNITIIPKANPQTSTDLNIGDTFTANWTVNATGDNNTAWELGAFFNSSYGHSLVKNNFSSNSTVCIGTCAVGPPPVDTCTYTSGNWAVDCSDNCSITSPVDVGGNDISIIGTGTFITTVDIINFGELLIAGDSSSQICEVSCLDGGCFK